MTNLLNMTEDSTGTRIKTSSFKSNTNQGYKEKSKSKERKKDFSEQRRKKREFEWKNLWLKKTI